MGAAKSWLAGVGGCAKIGSPGKVASISMSHARWWGCGSQPFCFAPEPKVFKA
jgi:hypothetical protein